MPPITSILVIDDNREAREFLTILLGSEGAAGVCALNSAEEALQRLEHDRFGLIICDYHLEGMSGLQFVEELRARRDDTPVLILTGSSDKALEALVHRCAKVGFFTKPFQLQQLEGAIEKLLAS